jgi:O-antigen ligase
MNYAGLRMNYFSQKTILSSINHLIPFLLGIFLFLSPFDHTTSIKEICFHLSIFLTLLLALFKKTHFSFRTPLSIPVFLFVFWSFLSTFWALDRQNSVHDFRVLLLNQVMLFFLLVNFFNSKKRFLYLTWVVVFSATAFTASGLFYNYIVLGNSLTDRYSATLSSEFPINFMGTLSVLSIVLCLHYLFSEIRLSYKVMFVFCLLPPIAASFLSQSRGTLFALFIAVTMHLIFKNIKLLLVFLLSIFVIFTFTPLKKRLDLTSLQRRIQINRVVLEVMKDFPFTGIGFGMENFRRNLDLNKYIERVPPKHRTSSIEYPHNILLCIAVRTGIIGLGFFLLMFYVSIKMIWQIMTRGKSIYMRRWGHTIFSGLAAYYTIGIVEPLFVFRTSATVFYTLMAMATIIFRLNRDYVYDREDG